VTAWQLIRTHLAADSSVTSIATGGIYPVRGKQDPSGPQIVGAQTGGSDPESIDGSAILADSVLDIGCIASSYDSAVSLYEAVKTSLRSMRKTTVSSKRIESVQIANPRDEDTPDINPPWFSRTFTVSIKHQL
jgi:hypothetical protein